MKISKKITSLLGILTLASTGACVEFSQSLCEFGTVSDVPGFAEARYVHFYDSESLSVVTADLGIEHIGRGLYRGSDGVTVRTCVIGNRFYSEQKNEFGTYSASLIEVADDSVSSIALMIGREELDQLGISYRIEKRDFETQNQDISNFKVTQKKLTNLVLKPFPQFEDQSVNVLIVEDLGLEKAEKLLDSVKPSPGVVRMSKIN